MRNTGSMATAGVDTAGIQQTYSRHTAGMENFPLHPLPFSAKLE